MVQVTVSSRRSRCDGRYAFSAVRFATAPLVVAGHEWVRHLDTCPVGVATQNLLPGSGLPEA